MRRRLEALEGRAGQDPPSEAHSEARARMKEHLDEIAAAKREGRSPAEWTVPTTEFLEEHRRRRES